MKFKTNKFNKHILVLVPARGNSKGIYRKNLVKINGKPLIDFTIEAAKKSKYVSNIWVSSDDTEILNYAKFKGVNALTRPQKISLDTSLASDVVRHFISNLSEEIKEKDPIILYLQPTSPLRNNKHIDKAISTFFKQKVQSLIAITELKYSPYKSFLLNHNNEVEPLFNKYESNLNRQDLPITYRPNGSIYMFLLSKFILEDNFPSINNFGFLMKEEDSLDIDDINDLKIASQFLRKTDQGN